MRRLLAVAVVVVVSALAPPNLPPGRKPKPVRLPAYEEPTTAPICCVEHGEPVTRR